MNIPGLKYIQSLPGRNLTEQVSIHTKTQIKSDIGSIGYCFKVLYQDLNLPKCEIAQEVLQKLGITHIGKTLEEGIRIIGRKSNHIISSPKPNLIRLTYLNKINGEAERIVSIYDKETFYEQTKFARLDDFEDDVSETLDFLNWKLISLRQKATPPVPQPYIPTKDQKENLDKINKALNKPKTDIVPVTDVFLGENETKLTKEIIENFTATKDAFKKFNNNVTSYNVRTYYPNYISTDSGINTYAFKAIGPNQENISISLMTHKGKNYVMLKAYDEKKASAFVISETGTVQKNMPYEKVYTEKSHKRYDSVPEYYTQAELDKSSLGEYLACVNKELKSFEEHTVNWQKKQVDFIASHTNKDVGSLENLTPKINRIFKSIDKLKENLRKRFPYLSDSEEFRQKNNINIEFSRRGVRFPNITREKYDLRITFPSVQGKRATQILLMDGEEIKQSFYILDEKLVKLEIKKLSDAFTHPNRKIYYHTQEYIENSRLEEFVNLISKTLNRANKITADTTVPN